MSHSAVESNASPAMIVDLPGTVTPEGAVAALSDLSNLVFLDSSRRGPRTGRYSYVCAAPSLLLRATGTRVTVLRGGQIQAELTGSPLAILREFLPYRPAISGLPPFQGGAVGYFGYELRHHFESGVVLPPDVAGVPDLVVGVYDWVICWDHLLGRGWLVSQPATSHGDGTGPPCEQILERLRGGARPVSSTSDVGEVHLRSNFSHADYLTAVRRALGYLAEGEIYELNLSQRFRGTWSGDAWQLYRRLRSVSPAPYAAFLDFGEVKVLSASPERFLRLTGRRVDTHPIKGTRARGRTPEVDRVQAEELAASVKDQAENLMIVDLMRNDLGKVCTIGSIEVPRLFAVEGYAQVWQLVSMITGELRPEYDALDLLAACFPGGSVTGCPKIRVMDLIAELERVPRGVYCGAIGYLGYDGSMDTNIVIRTIVISGNTLAVQVGGAIVADSDPEEEYAETLTKAAGAFQALGASVEDGP